MVEAGKAFKATFAVNIMLLGYVSACNRYTVHFESKY